MRQAIVTKFIAPTNHRGARVKAIADAGSKIVPWIENWDGESNHRYAAERLADAYGWRDRGAKLLGGSLPRNGGYCFVLTDDKP